MRLGRERPRKQPAWFTFDRVTGASMRLGRERPRKVPAVAQAFAALARLQ